MDGLQRRHNEFRSAENLAIFVNMARIYFYGNFKCEKPGGGFTFFWEYLLEGTEVASRAEESRGAAPVAGWLSGNGARLPWTAQKLSGARTGTEIGPTGSYRTSWARRLAPLTDSPPGLAPPALRRVSPRPAFRRPAWASPSKRRPRIFANRRESPGRARFRSLPSVGR